MSRHRPADRATEPGRAAATSLPPRVALVDAARGCAIVMMIAYHFCFDLTYFHWADWPMLDDARWIAWRSAIVTSFLFLVGLSLALRDHRERATRRSAWFDRGFVRRWGQVAAAAALVTAGSALLFPGTWIYFGVLHFVAVALWLCRRAPRLGSRAVVLGVAVLAAGVTFRSEVFDPKLVNWIGFAAHKPLTEDYVPLFPWLGVVLIGCGLGAVWARRSFRLLPAADAAWRATPSALRRALAAMGRRSLAIYLLHQPLLIGAMTVVRSFG